MYLHGYNDAHSVTGPQSAKKTSQGTMLTAGLQCKSRGQTSTALACKAF